MNFDGQLFPVTGWRNGNPVPYDEEPVWYMAVSKYMAFESWGSDAPSGGLLDRAARAADVLMHGEQPYMQQPITRWMLHKGYIAPEAKHYRSPYFYVWTYKLTAAGMEFAQRHAGPVGEW